MRALLPPLLLLLALLGAWELYVDLGGVNPHLLAAPHEIAREGFDNAGLIWHNTLVTLEEALLGLGLAVLAGFTLAVAIHFSKLVRRSAYPLAVGSQALPVAALAPMLAFWLGFGILPKLIVVALICFFPVTVTTVDGLASVDPEQLKLLRTLHASRAQSFRFVELPAAMPSVLTGARIALVVAWIATFIAETTSPTVGPYAGLGREVMIDFNDLNGARADAAVVILFLCAVLCFYALSFAERRVAAWAATRPGGQQ
ncbi:MAG: ABC transporter permease [Solirubrobacteraceae bacterium]